MDRIKGKIKTQAELLEIINNHKSHGKTIVQCDGVFDLVHPAHIHYFTQAKAQGDILYVSVVADAFVNKGPGRPLFDEQTRAYWVAGIDGVDYVLINNDAGPYKLIETIHPDVIVKGETYKTKPTEGFLRDKTLVESYGGRVHFSQEMPLHSTETIKKILAMFD